MKTNNSLAAVADTLAAAGGQIERRFLTAGEVLLAMMEGIDRLLELRGAMGDAFAEEQEALIQTHLEATVGQLQHLAKTVAIDRERLTDIWKATQRIFSFAEEISETLRRLKVTALITKIVSAGVAEFSGFTDEIAARIGAAEREITQLVCTLAELRKDLSATAASTGLILVELRQKVPLLSNCLHDDATFIAGYYQALRNTASNVGNAAASAKNRSVAVLSALQIGDITRQRLEHVYDAIGLISKAGAEHDAVAYGRIFIPFLAAQLADTADGFEAGTTYLESLMDGFTADMELLGPSPDLEDEDTVNSSTINVLAGRLRDALDSVAKIEEAGDGLKQAGSLTSSRIEGLIDKVGAIRVSRTEITYMALNANLRCGGLSDSGKAIATTASELRALAEKLDQAADNVITAIHDLGRSNDALNDTSGVTSGDMSGALRTAVQIIETIADQVQANHSALAIEKHKAAIALADGINRMDFRTGLGELLEECRFRLAATDSSCPPAPMPDDEIGNQIFKLYTMEAERVIHRRFFHSERTVQDEQDIQGGHVAVAMQATPFREEYWA